MGGIDVNNESIQRCLNSEVPFTAAVISHAALGAAGARGAFSWSCRPVADPGRPQREAAGGVRGGDLLLPCSLRNKPHSARNTAAGPKRLGDSEGTSAWL